MRRAWWFVLLASSASMLATGDGCSPYEEGSATNGPVDATADGAPVGDASAESDVDAREAGDAGAPRRVFVFGGTADPSGVSGVLEAYSAAALPDGKLGPWERAPELDTLHFSGGHVTTSGAIVYAGGAKPGEAQTHDVLVAGIAPLTALSAGPPLTAPRTGLALAHSDGRLFATGGLAYTSPSTAIAFSDVWGTTISGTSLTPWVDASTLPAPRGGHGSVVVGDRLVVFGGFRSEDGGPLLFSRETWASTIDASGALGPWVKHGDLPSPRVGTASVVVGSRIFAIGGVADDLAVTNAVASAAVSPGSAITWGAAAPLPAIANSPCAVVVGDVIYVLGGFDSTTGPSATTQAFAGRIAANGGVTWETLAPMPVARAAFACTAH